MGPLECFLQGQNVSHSKLNSLRHSFTVWGGVRYFCSSSCLAVDHTLRNSAAFSQVCGALSTRLTCSMLLQGMGRSSICLLYIRWGSDEGRHAHLPCVRVANCRHSPLIDAPSVDCERSVILRQCPKLTFILYIYKQTISPPHVTRTTEQPFPPLASLNIL